VAIDEGTAEERTDHERRELHQPDRADCGGRTGQAVDLDVDRDERDARSRLGEDLTDPEQPEVAMAQRGEVDRQRAQPTQHSKISLGRTGRGNAFRPRIFRPFHSTFASGPG
jgi:hypothetical protein